VNPHDRPSVELHKEADFRLQLRPGILAASQFPDAIPGTAIHKPVGW